MKKLFKSVIVKILEIEARIVIWRYKPKIVAVTGSVGKTSTKDAIYAVLASAYSTRKSQKSFNSEIGVPLTVLGLQNGWNNGFVWIANIARGFWLAIWKRPYPQWLVLEVGADRPGDIRRTASWLKPDISVITYIGTTPVHVEFFKSQAELVEEKSYLAQALKQGGVLILNADDEEVAKFKRFTKGRTMMVRAEPNGASGLAASASGAGVAEGDIITASHRMIHYDKNSAGEEVPAGISFKVNVGGNCVPVTRHQALGIQHMYPSLFAVAVGISQGLNLVSITEALSREPVTVGRMRLIEGDNGSLIIDDTYNSSPSALHEAVKALDEARVSGRKIAVLGDMLELGKHSSTEHAKAGRAVAKASDILVTVGFRARGIAEGALDGGMDDTKVMQFEYSPQAGVYVDSILSHGDLVLVKGSQSMRMERVVEEIMLHPEDRAHLLVRQDEEWMRR